MNETPGGKIEGRPLHFFFLFDCSGSMVGPKIESLNFAVREAIPLMQSVAKQNETAQILIRAIAFSNGARWITSQATGVEEFRWSDLQADGSTDMGKALEMVAEQLHESRMPQRGLKPVIVLISDGQPSDNFELGMKTLLAQRWGEKAVRIAIAIGNDADSAVLDRFIGNPEIPLLTAKNPGDITKYIRWASTTLVEHIAKPPSQVAYKANGPMRCSAAALVTASSSTGDDDVW